MNDPQAVVPPRRRRAGARQRASSGLDDPAIEPLKGIAADLHKTAMQHGVELIEFADELKQQPRDPAAQKLVEAFINRALNTALNDQMAITRKAVNHISRSALAKDDPNEPE